MGRACSVEHRGLPCFLDVVQDQSGYDVGDFKLLTADRPALLTSGSAHVSSSFGIVAISARCPWAKVCISAVRILLFSSPLLPLPPPSFSARTYAYGWQWLHACGFASALLSDPTAGTITVHTCL